MSGAERHDKGQGEEMEGDAVPKGHHYAAPEVEEWQPHPYAEEGVGRQESLKGELPEQKADEADVKR